MYGPGNGYYGYDEDESPGESSEECQPAIVLAAKRGNLIQVQAIVESAKDDHERRKLVNCSGHWKEDTTAGSPSTGHQNGTQPLEWHDETPLLAAIAADCSETVEYLLRKGADPTLEAHPDYMYHVSPQGILRRRINFRTNDKPENYLQNHDPSFVIFTHDPPSEAAKRVFKRAHGHLRSAVLLGTALKFWKKADYSSARYSGAREHCAYSNRPADRAGLLQALDKVPPLATPNEEILATLASQVAALRQAAELDDDTDDDESSSDDDYAPLYAKKGPNGKKLKKVKKKKTKTKIKNKNSKYKTHISTYAPPCRFFTMGYCRYGDKCHFKHEK